MKYMRWYDNHTSLQKLLEFLEKLPPQQLQTISSDIIQIIFSEIGESIDNSMSDIYQAKDFPQNRWYDEYPELTNSLEVIKHLSPAKIDFVVNRIFEAVYYICLENNDVQ